MGESKTYHVMIRGNERRNLFINDEDKVLYTLTLKYWLSTCTRMPECHRNI